MRGLFGTKIKGNFFQRFSSEHLHVSVAEPQFDDPLSNTHAAVRLEMAIQGPNGDLEYFGQSTAAVTARAGEAFPGCGDWILGR